MTFGPLLVAGLLAATSPAVSDVRDVAIRLEPAAAASAPVAGSIAPDFTFQSHDYLWQRLHNLLEQGDVLLVFGANDDELRALERDHESLLRAGIVAVGVTSDDEAGAWRTIRRCNLTYSLLADPHAAIARPYGATIGATNRLRGTWCLIDRSGHVRGTGEGAGPAAGWPALAQAVLGRSDLKTAAAR
ncbi:MAG TPA: redoxin domain-containing protein [Candidatus Acidoferrales bacterium]|nr:redoxin domain-containing protein [Candidatus Acidoferrales bacterium]